MSILFIPGVLEAKKLQQTFGQRLYCHPVYLITYSELQTAVDKGRDRGAALLSRDTGLCMPVLVICCGMALEFSASGRSRQPQLACRPL
ncbi:hypothetical protein Y032_0731g1904 [Ancylostoma ceylanicum]|uniref:Uncharacterized protein n=1 Tax=Ancylostoma ceylanicum TaxID=53326 RepID=A0A016WEH9_9BILA|nr:hypothetical protein Y032_0731g1904 [Ancylostoma ceylanicum]